MKKLLNFLLVRRSETENKWWHRLSNILVVGSSVIVLIIGLFVVFYDFTTHKQYQVRDFIKTTTLTLEEIQEMDKIAGGKTTAKLSDGSYIINGEPTSRVDAVRYIGFEAEKERAKQKIINNQKLQKNIFLVIGISVGWFIFWNFIIYRSILYIIFGKKIYNIKKHNDSENQSVL